MRIDLTEIAEVFPFADPRVFPIDAPWSWHRESSGALCIYTDQAKSTLPWLDIDNFLQRISRWFDLTSSGWPADGTELDLDRYYEQDGAFPPLIYSSTLPIGSYFEVLRDETSGAAVSRVGNQINRAARRSGAAATVGLALDIGDLAVPPRSWDDLVPLLTQPQVFQREILTGKLQVLALRYRRAEFVGLVCLACSNQDGQVHLAAVASFSEDAKYQNNRRGPAHAALRSKKVCVVGGGSIGSFLVDQLVRGGVGVVAVVDGKTLKPGNTPRHLAEQFGAPKASAIAATERDRLAVGQKVVPIDGQVVSLSRALELLDDYSLVIDATGASRASAVLQAACRITHSRILAVATQNEGQTIRVDIIPPLRGRPLRTVKTRVSFPQSFEPGCDDPVSGTPPYAVFEAAALCARYAVSILTGQPLSRAGQIRDYRRRSALVEWLRNKLKVASV